MRLSIQESAAVILGFIQLKLKDQTISYGKDYYDTEETSRIGAGNGKGQN